MKKIFARFRRADAAPACQHPEVRKVRVTTHVDDPGTVVLTRIRGVGGDWLRLDLGTLEVSIFVGSFLPTPEERALVDKVAKALAEPVDRWS